MPPLYLDIRTLEAHQLQFRNSSALLFLLLVHLERQTDYVIPSGLQSQVKVLLQESLCQPKNRTSAELLVDNILRANDIVEIDLLTDVIRDSSDGFRVFSRKNYCLTK